MASNGFTSAAGRSRVACPRGLPLALLLSLPAPACGRKATEPSDPEPGAAPARVAVVFDEPIDELEAQLAAAAKKQQLSFAVEASHGHAAAQIEQVGRLLDTRPAVLLLGPVVPDVLQRARSAAAAKQVPIVALLRGDGRSGSWVGVASATLARDAGARAGAWLHAAAVARPRVIVVEDPRWPETTRRVEESLRGLEASCGGIELLLRVGTMLTSAETAAALVEAIRRAGRVDVLVAGDRAATAAAVAGADGSALKASLLVVGTSDDPQLADAARAPQSRLLLVAWKREEFVRQALDALSAVLAEPATEVKREVECELIGLTAPKPGGS